MSARDFSPQIPSRGKALAVSLAGLLVLVYYFWTATQGLFGFETSGGSLRLLELQAEAYQAGQLHLQVTPSSDLIKASNPYDPEVNRATRLLDASLYQGRYYTYFGPVSSALLLWPYYAAFNRHIPGDFLAWMLASLALVFQAGCLLQIAGRWLPQTPAWTLAGATLVLGGTSLLAPLLRHHGTFEITVLAGIAFGSAAWFFLLLAWTRETWGGLWCWALASLSFGLTAGSRPNLLPVAALSLALGLAIKARRHPDHHRLWFCALTPFALCLAALAAYNYTRFGSLLEFGNTYTLIEVDWRKTAPFSLTYLPLNVYFYFLSWPRLSWFFPFFLESASLPFSAAPGYLVSYVDRMAGILPCYPFLTLGPIVLLASLGANRHSAVDRVLLSLLFYAAIVAGPLLFFMGSSVRYQAEIAAPLALAATVGLLQIGELAPTVWRTIAGFVAGTAGVVTLGANLIIGCQPKELFAAANPAGYSQIESRVNRAATPLARLYGWRPQVACLDMQFPTERFGRLEPLFVHGRVPETDFIYLLYTSPQFIQIGVESMGRGGPVSDLIPLDYGTPHRMELILGAFLPPAGHPFYPQAGLGDGALLHRMLRIKLDGQIVLDAVVDYHAGREHFLFGESPEELAFGRSFGGKLAVHWRPFRKTDAADWLAPENFGPARLEVTWPEQAAPRTELLLSIGAKNRGEFVLAHFAGNNTVRLALRDTTGRESVSEPLTIMPGHTSILVVHTPGLTHSIGAKSPSHDPGKLILDGNTVLIAPMSRLEAGPASVILSQGKLIQGMPPFSGPIRFSGRLKE